MRTTRRHRASGAPHAIRRLTTGSARIALLGAALWLATARPALADPAIPLVHAFTPHEGEPGTIVKIAGENLDRVLWIEFAGGARADFRLFTTTMLKVAVPAGAASGPILLRTELGGAWTPADFRVIEPPPGGLSLAPPVPNPGRAPYRVSFNLPAERRVRLGVFDVRGRRVRALVDDTLGRGPHLALWDGRDAAGHRAAPGLYLVTLRIDRGFVTRRLVVLE